MVRAVVIALLCVSWLLLGSPVDRWPCSQGYDESFYVATAMSLLWDRDTDLENNLRAWGYTPSPPWYGVQSEFPLGTSLLLMPPLALMRGFDRMVDRATLCWRLGLYMTALGLLGVLLAVRLLRAMGFSVDESWCAVGVAFWGSPAPYWVLMAPGYSHAASILAVSAFCLAAWRVYKAPDLLGRWALASGLLGAVYLIRWADVVIAVVLFPALWRALATRRVVLPLVCFGMAMATLCMVQWAFWRVHLGYWYVCPQDLNLARVAIIGSPYLEWFNPHWDRLWGNRNAILPYCPAFVLALAGFALSRPWRSRVRAAPLVALLVMAYLVLIPREDGGAGMGARRFTGALALMAVGIALGLSRLRRGRSGTFSALVILSWAFSLWNLARWEGLSQ